MSVSITAASWRRSPVTPRIYWGNWQSAEGCRRRLLRARSRRSSPVPRNRAPCHPRLGLRPPCSRAEAADGAQEDGSTRRLDQVVNMKSRTSNRAGSAALIAVICFLLGACRPRRVRVPVSPALCTCTFQTPLRPVSIDDAEHARNSSVTPRTRLVRKTSC